MKKGGPLFRRHERYLDGAMLVTIFVIILAPFTAGLSSPWLFVAVAVGGVGLVGSFHSYAKNEAVALVQAELDKLRQEHGKDCWSQLNLSGQEGMVNSRVASDGLAYGLEQYYKFYNLRDFEKSEEMKKILLSVYRDTLIGGNTQRNAEIERLIYR